MKHVMVQSKCGLVRRMNQTQGGHCLYLFFAFNYGVCLPYEARREKNKKSLFERLQIAEWCCESYF